MSDTGRTFRVSRLVGGLGLAIAGYFIAIFIGIVGIIVAPHGRYEFADLEYGVQLASMATAVVWVILVLLGLLFLIRRRADLAGGVLIGVLLGLASGFLLHIPFLPYLLGRFG